MTSRAVLSVLALSLAASAGAFAQTTTQSTSPGAPGNPPSAPATPPPTAPTAPSAMTPTTPTTPNASAQAPSSDNNAVNTSSQNNPGAPIPGANSFTEGQAQSRIGDQGFTNVSGLKLDNQGIWRGTATKDGKTVDVAMDYQGNVVGK